MSARLNDGGEVGWDLSGARVLTRLSERDIAWLQALADGRRICQLEGSEYAKQRLQAVRRYMQVRTTVQAVAEALRRGMIK